MKTYTLNEIQDALIGAIGTPDRDRFEAELQKALQKKATNSGCIINTMTEINEKNAPTVSIDPSLDKYNNVVLFPEKLAKANEQLKKSGFPNPAEKIKSTK